MIEREQYDSGTLTMADELPTSLPCTAEFHEIKRAGNEMLSGLCYLRA